MRKPCCQYFLILGYLIVIMRIEMPRNLLISGAIHFSFSPVSVMKRMFVSMAKISNNSSGQNLATCYRGDRLLSVVSSVAFKAKSSTQSSLAFHFVIGFPLCHWLCCSSGPSSAARRSRHGLINVFSYFYISLFIPFFTILFFPFMSYTKRDACWETCL